MHCLHAGKACALSTIHARSSDCLIYSSSRKEFPKVYAVTLVAKIAALELMYPTSSLGNCLDKTTEVWRLRKEGWNENAGEGEKGTGQEGLDLREWHE